MAVKQRKQAPSHHTVGKHAAIVVKRLSLLPAGGKMRDLPKELWHKSYLRTGEKKTGGPNIRMLRLSPDKPSNTVTAFIFNKFVHPVEHRYLTPREAARLQGFPDDFDFAGPVTSVQTQIGNAVPVQLASAVADHVKRYMEEKTRLKTEALNAISLFTGAGGMDLGFGRHFNILAAVEFEKEFCATLRLNFPELNVLHADVCGVTAKAAAGSKRVHLVFGGPPCQSFSAAGKQRGFSDRRGQMVQEYTRIVDEAQADFFVMENVPGMLGIDSGRLVQDIVRGFNDIGYLVETHVLCAADYGAAQMRRRLFFLGRKSKYKDPMGPPPKTHSDSPTLFGEKPYRGVMDAIGDLPSPTSRYDD